jgi:predicted nucleic acid-binding protein
VILVDTGPLVALFDPRDEAHARCRSILSSVDQALVSTDPVLTEALHMLGPGSLNSARLRAFVAEPALNRWVMDDERLRRAFDLMDQYEDHPMDFADASLVAAAETLRVTTIFTLDRVDFTTYRPRIGRTLSRFRIL